MGISRILTGCIVVILIGISACTRSLKDEDLYGVWQYVKIENPNQGTVTPDEEVRENDPSIRFSDGNKLEMVWNGEILSHGTYHLQYPLINYREDLKEKGSREIKFLIKKLENDVLVFQTMEADAIRVTARKVDRK